MRTNVPAATKIEQKAAKVAAKAALKAAKPERTATISPDRWYIGAGAIVLVMAIMLSSMIFSFNAITEAAAWTGNPEKTYPLAAIFIDGAILTYTISYSIFRWRGEKGIRTRVFLYLFTAISVAVNFAHTAAFWDWDFSQLNAWFGVLIAVAAPIAALLSSEEVVYLAFTKPSKKAAADGADKQETVSAGPLPVAGPATEEPPVEEEDSAESEVDNAAFDALVAQLEEKPAPVAEDSPATAVFIGDDPIDVFAPGVVLDKPGYLVTDLDASMNSDVELGADDAEQLPAPADVAVEAPAFETPSLREIREFEEQQQRAYGAQ